MAELFSRIGVTDFEKVSIEITDLTMSRGNAALFSGLSVHVTNKDILWIQGCLLYTSPSPRDLSTSRMPSSA